jgi:hypothetical protein
MPPPPPNDHSVAAHIAGWLIGTTIIVLCVLVAVFGIRRHLISRKLKRNGDVVEEVTMAYAGPPDITRIVHPVGIPELIYQQPRPNMVYGKK